MIRFFYSCRQSLHSLHNCFRPYPMGCKARICLRRPVRPVFFLMPFFRKKPRRFSFLFYVR
ncbi:MAG: hypothetical protein BM485_15660 [Desulfobulbaceae bacterium DB1]|nr:MAG: hypothetical protein BM485_15660 [Desulfobulbaceae bacterium DB1]